MCPSVRRPVKHEERSTRVFRALLALYPAVFRDEYRRELTLLFIDRYRDAATPWDRARLFLGALIGVLAEAPKEHYSMILQDLRYAARALRQHAFLTTTIVLTLGLGIGANTAMFSLLNTVVLRTLPVPDANHLSVIRARSPLASGNRFSGPMFERLRQGAPEGVGLAAMSRVARVYARNADGREIEPAALQLVSPDYFRVLGVTPVRGRALPGDEDGALAASPVAVVSHACWRRRFGGAPDVVGRTLVINGTGFTIVGVGPQGFSGVWLDSPVDVWVPLTMQGAVKYSQNYSADGADFSRGWLSQERIWWLEVIARSRPEQTAATTAALNASVQSVANDARITLEPFAQGFSGVRQRFEAPLYALIAMAALVLLIACANVANLLLARAAGRERDIAVRMALGAGRGRLLQQLLAESALLVLMAGAAALLFARWAGDLLVRTATASATGPAPFAAAVDMRVLGFTGAVAFTSVVLFGLVPAWRQTRLDFVGALKAGARGASGSSRTRPARFLVMLQVALSLVLVTGTGLLVRSFQNLLDIELGFEREHLLSVSIDPRLSSDASKDMPGLHQRLLDAATAVPGVSSASLAMCGIQGGCRSRETGLNIEGYRARPDEQVAFMVNVVSPGYFSTVGLRLVAGRALNDGDLANTPTVAVVNKTLATKYFADGQAIGRRFGQTARNVEIVGIVDDARLLNVKEPAVPSVFFSLAQRQASARSLDVRTKGDPAPLAAAVRRAIAETAPDLPIEGITTMEERVRVGLSQERLVMLLTSGFGALALGLAGFGLFGVLSYAVARRTSEFGIRMALGASRSHVLWTVVREALWLVLCGFLLGIPFVLLGGDLVSSLFFGVSPRDWATLLAATVTLLGVGVVCSMLPALRASRVDPIVALRQE